MRTRCRVHLDRLLEPEGGSAGNWGTPSEVQDAVDNRVRCWRPCWATRVLLVMRPDDGAGDSGGDGIYGNSLHCLRHVSSEVKGTPRSARGAPGSRQVQKCARQVAKSPFRTFCPESTPESLTTRCVGFCVCFRFARILPRQVTYPCEDALNRGWGLRKDPHLVTLQIT